MRRWYDEDSIAAAPRDRVVPPPQADAPDLVELASTVGNRAFAGVVGALDARGPAEVYGGDGDLVDTRPLQRQPAGGVVAPGLPGPVAPGGMTGVTATIPAAIRHVTTPKGMAVDRIPPRVDIPVTVNVSGWAIPMAPVEVAIENGGGGNGTCTLDGAATTLVGDTGGTTVLRGVTQTDRGKGANLRVVARLGSTVLARSNPFAVAAIPQNWSCTKSSELTGARRGFIVQDRWESDSGSVADLNETEISELVEQTSATGVFVGATPVNSSYLPGDSFTTDTHGTPAAMVTGPGTRDAAQTSMFRDHRTGVTDIPMTNSGYTLKRTVLNFGPGGGFWLQTLKFGEATTAKGIASAAGVGVAIAIQP